MMGLSEIRRVNLAASRKVRRTKPRLISSIQAVEDIFEHRSKGFPYVGDNCEKFDEKHERIETLFVDISGFGAPNEIALTLNQLQRRLTELVKEHGKIYAALEETGQFQGYLAIWKRK